MSVQIIERRYCDVCERDYESDKPDWMILSAPNAPEQVEASWDFCSYACLVSWISIDEVDDAGPDFGPEHDAALAMGTAEQPRTRTPEELAEAQARMDAAMRQASDKPPMSLLEALSSGALQFDRGPQ